VLLKAERVGTGFAVEIEDRGLGVKPELLAEANRRLAEPPEYDIVDTDQLGLFVVARLAARHAISVTLQRSPYGGVTAIVLLPHDLVVPAEQMAAGALPPAPEPDGDGASPLDTRADGEAEGEPGAVLVPAPRAGTAALPEAVVRLRETQPPPRTAPNPWSDEAVPQPVVTVQATAEGDAAANDAGNDAGNDGDDDWEPAGTAGTHAGLPRRVRQKNLAPQLRKRPPPPPVPAGGGASGGIARSPEEARSLMASIQQGWRRGRATDVGEEGTR
jgi:hypothetical protein